MRRMHSRLKESRVLGPSALLSRSHYTIRQQPSPKTGHGPHTHLISPTRGQKLHPDRVSSAARCMSDSRTSHMLTPASGKHNARMAVSQVGWLEIPLQEPAKNTQSLSILKNRQWKQVHLVGSQEPLYSNGVKQVQQPVNSQDLSRLL